MSIWTYIKSQMLKNPTQTICEKDAVMTFEECVVYAELFGKSLKNEKCCAIYCKSEMAAALSLLACFAANTTAVPLSSRYGEKHASKILERISPTCIITDENGDHTISQINDSTYKIPKNIPAVIMCTSGTTGMPKGVMLSSKNIISNIEDILEYFPICKNDSILISRPLYHCAVLTGEFLSALCAGTRIVFSSEKFNPLNIISLLRSEHITTFCGTPTLLKSLLPFIKRDKPNLKYIVVSGECMPPDVEEKLQATFNETQIFHVYGLTEACPRVSYLPPEFFGKSGCAVGIPLKSVQIKIIDIYGNRVKPNDFGLLYVKGPNVTIGYYNDKNLTKKMIQDHWLCTGDLATITDQGFLKIKCRADDMIIRAGMNIYPQEIEAQLSKDPRTKEVLAYGYSDENIGTSIGMKISGDFSCVDDVRKLCIEVLPAYLIPSKFELLEQLPRNASGKITRRQIND